jgi:hypothetical protein
LVDVLPGHGRDDDDRDIVFGAALVAFEGLVEQGIGKGTGRSKDALRLGACLRRTA